MKKTSFLLLLIYIISFIIAVPSFVYAENKEQVNSHETDRVIVKITDEAGVEIIESITWEERASMNQPSTFRSSSTTQDYPIVEMLEPDYMRHIAATTEVTPIKSWGTKRIGAIEMQKQISSKKGTVVVAVIDTGVDYTHTLLKERMIAGYDFVDNDTNPMDAQYHGTHVAGIIAESTPNNIKIMPIRALDNKGSGYDTNIAKSIRYAVDKGAAVINMSFSGNQYSKHLSSAIDYALSKNVLLVVASGNDGADTANFYPASEKKVIVVGATNENDQIAYFSNRGATIDLSAPGVGITSSLPGERYGKMNGTSMSTPYVSAVAAMLKLDNPTKSLIEIERLIKKHVDDRGATGWDPLFGEGIVNVASYKTATPSKPSTVVGYIPLPEQKGVVLNKQWSVNFNQKLTDTNIIIVKVIDEKNEFPITVKRDNANKKILVTPKKNYEPNKTYRLEVDIRKGKSYLMEFTTKDYE